MKWSVSQLIVIGITYETASDLGVSLGLRESGSKLFYTLSTYKDFYLIIPFMHKESVHT